MAITGGTSQSEATPPPYERPMKACLLIDSYNSDSSDSNDGIDGSAASSTPTADNTIMQTRGLVSLIRVIPTTKD
ncbi:hypothetical protein K4F52_009967 [Lecanicillium sp. MT-2017a]|nr:hypothetical protein K4F52_009967 [Lecanicillium sp. MT-2017a]